MASSLRARKKALMHVLETEQASELMSQVAHLKVVNKKEEEEKMERRKGERGGRGGEGGRRGREREGNEREYNLKTF